MVNIFLFIELLSEANPNATMEQLKQLTLSNCDFASLIRLSKQKLVAQLDCSSYEHAVRAILEQIAPTKGIVQTNIISAVRPTGDF